ncbi:MAG TPA: hypothetical protein VMS77_04890 [Conexivisphaerales archaeon]|nr:hypothetical protein [Conexivisphaerales archaeon]
MPIDREKELRKYRRLIGIVGLLSLVVTFGSYFVLVTYFPLVVAYVGSGALALPLLYVLWKLDSRYGDLQFRDDL